MFKFIFTDWDNLRNDPLAKERFKNSILKTICFLMFWAFTIHQAWTFGKSAGEDEIQNVVTKIVDEKIMVLNLRLAAVEAQISLVNKKLERVVIKPQFLDK